MDTSGLTIALRCCDQGLRLQKNHTRLRPNVAHNRRETAVRSVAVERPCSCAG